MQAEITCLKEELEKGQTNQREMQDALYNKMLQLETTTLGKQLQKGRLELRFVPLKLESEKESEIKHLLFELDQAKNNIDKLTDDNKVLHRTFNEQGSAHKGLQTNFEEQTMVPSELVALVEEELTTKASVDEENEEMEVETDATFQTNECS